MCVLECVCGCVHMHAFFYACACVHMSTPLHVCAGGIEDNSWATGTSELS